MTERITLRRRFVAASTFLSPADAARRLGVSAKALRLWEERGLIAPGRTVAGWRAYGPEEMARAAEIVALRALGLSLTQVASVLGGEDADLGPVLQAHEAALEARLGETSAAIGRVREMRARIAAGARVSVAELAALQQAVGEVIAAFDLPWPWGGERFELRGGKALTWIVGPLFSGKTKLAMKIAETVPGAVFVGLERGPVETDAAHAARMAATIGWLVEDGASESEALLALVSALEAEAPGAFVVDLIEQGLDEATQLALAAWLRGRADRRPVFAMTRSSAMLDLSSVGADEALLLCPANHSPPVLVAPYPGAPGYEVLASCLGPPEVRARTEGVIAIRAPAA
jgi:DNA-binding transcriptional MerR regulator